MAQVETVRGAIDVDELGTTLMHEHVFVLSTEILENYGHAWWDEETRVADAVSKLRELKARGVDSIVDPTVIGLGRDVGRLHRVNEQVDINIVVATGLYTYHDLPFPFRARGPGTEAGGPDPMIAAFVGDIRDGIGTTGVRAAFLKCAVEEAQLTRGVERTLRAVAKAHVETGAPITVHTNPGRRNGLDVIRVFGEEGVDMRKVVLGHSGDSNDIEHLGELLDSGAILGMDRFGLDVYNPTDKRVATIAELCRAGHADQMVLSHDASCFLDWYPMPEEQSLLAAALPNWHYTHIHDDVLPALREQGVSDADIRTMLVDTPRRYFTPESRP
jgi:phosphotriesterase-related protein